MKPTHIKRLVKTIVEDHSGQFVDLVDDMLYDDDIYQELLDTGFEFDEQSRPLSPCERVVLEAYCSEFQ